MDARRSLKSVAWALFLLSGFSGLVYEVLWTRHLTLVFGNTVAAASTVLAAYMGGLALGAWLVGRFADRARRPLLLYAILEAVVGLSALAFPIVLSAVTPVMQGLYRGGHLGALAWVRFLIAFLFLLVPTAAMGGTLPALARLFARVEAAGRTLALLYGINTLGATLGTLAAGFWLLPRWGLSGTLAAAVAINALVAAAGAAIGFAVKADTSEAPSPAAKHSGEGPGAAAPDGAGGAYRLVLGAFLLSGALALALEVYWTRSLLLVFGSTVYSFTTMLAVFLFGLALGSAVFGLFVERLRYPVLALGLVEAGAGLVTLASVSRVNALPSAFLDGLIAHGFTWDSYMVQKFLIAGGILLPVSFLFGATFPLVARVEVFRGERIGGQVGRMYAFNTVGAIAGSLLAGFVILPALGLQRSLVMTALAAVALGVVLLLGGGGRAILWPRLVAALLLAALGVAFAASLPPWDRKVLSAGVYFRPRTYVSPDGKRNVMEQVLGDLKVLQYLEGVTETAAVVENPISRMFIVDGKVEAATDFVDMRLQRLQGHLPMLLARGEEKAINIGLGCGITLGALKTHPVKALQCVELEKDILRTARYFAEQNHRVLDDPRLTVVLNDGRNHLLLTDQTYDVITSDPFEPLVGGAASLYTEDHFRTGMGRLAEGGLFCQYLPMYQLSPDDYRMIVRSFCRVYPHVTFWYTGIDTILVGSREPQRIDLKSLRARMSLPGVRESLAQVGITDPVHLLQTFVMDPAKVPGLLDGPANTDLRPAIEFSAPRSHLVNTTPMNLRWLMENYRPGDLPLDLSDPEAAPAAEKARAIGALVMQASLERLEGRYAEALVPARKARELDPGNRTVLFEISAAANQMAGLLLGAGRLDDAKALLDEALSTGEEPLATYGGLATWAFRSGNPELARDFIQKSLELNPNIPDTNLKMALCLQGLGKPEEAVPWCEKALSLNPKYTQARLARADLALALGDREGALRRYREVLEEENAGTGQDWMRLGVLLAETSSWPQARRALDRAARMEPENPVIQYNLARVAAAQGDAGASARALERARQLAPDQVAEWLKADPILGRR